jgi:hypothetical protein
MPERRTCPYCGQRLATRAAVEHLRREERRRHEQARKDAMNLLRTDPSIRRELERKWRVRHRTHDDRRLEDLTTELRDSKDQLRVYARENRQLRRQSDQMSRRLERLDPSERGELSQDDLLQSLRRAFPSDNIYPVERGKAGTDIVHEIRDKMNGESAEAGRIIYESKDTQDWSERFIAQAKEDYELYQTRHAIVVSRVLPKDEKGFCVRDGVPVVHPANAVDLARLIRGFVVDVRRAGLSREDVDHKTEELYAYISGSEFQRRISGIVDKSGKLRDLLRKERQNHARIWTKRQQMYDDLGTLATEIDEAVRGIIEQKAAVHSTDAPSPREAVQAH